MAYAEGISYGEVFAQNEYEMSRYYLDDADVETAHTFFKNYTDEAQRMIDARLPVPAWTYVLKSSHAFNVLDARGASAQPVPTPSKPGTSGGTTTGPLRPSRRTGR